MGIFTSTKTATATLDPYLLLGAAHELGHAVSARHHRIPVTAITLDTATGAGLTELDLPRDDDALTEAQWRGWLIGCWAGWEAEVLWGRWHDGGASRRTCKQDIANFRRHRHRAPGLSESEARSTARTILRADWSRVKRLAPLLARHGHVTPW